MKLKVQQIGNPKFPRYAIVCENGVWWTGTEWSHEKKKAALYAKLAAAKEDWKKLSADMASGLTVLVANVLVTVKADRELKPEEVEELKWYLSSGSTFLLDYTKPRPDWLAKAVVSSKVIWGSLKKQE